MSASPAAPNGRKTIAVLFGGRSSEHGISCITAGGVLAALDRSRYDVVAVGITTSGRWVLVSDDPQQWQIVDGEAPVVPDDGPEVLLPTSADSRTWRKIVAGTVVDIGPVDVVFPLLHGPYGEDGTIQGALELLDVAYVGSGVLSSAACMDKEMMKTVLAGHNLPIGAYLVVQPGAWQHDPGAIAAQVSQLGYPVFVKPARAGSSMGISKVADPQGLPAAMAEALRHDRKVLIEAELRGREIECAVIDAARAGEPRASVPGEIIIGSAHEFYDYQAKYFDTAGLKLEAPAQLPTAVVGEIQRIAVETFRAVGAEGLARVDFFVDGDRIVVNEINTMPGFTPFSMYPLLWEKSGVPYGQLLNELIELALARPVGLR